MEAQQRHTTTIQESLDTLLAHLGVIDIERQQGISPSLRPTTSSNAQGIPAFDGEEDTPLPIARNCLKPGVPPSFDSDHADMRLDTLDTYIYFSTHSSHQHLDSILNPNFDLYTILPRQSPTNFRNIWITFSVIFMIFQSHKIVFVPRHTNTIVGIFPSPIMYRSSNILHLGFY